MTEKLLTINKKRLGIKIGELAEQETHAISRQLAKVLRVMGTQNLSLGSRAIQYRC
jgi:hypothetical protein